MTKDKPQAPAGQGNDLIERLDRFGRRDKRSKFLAKMSAAYLHLEAAAALKAQAAEMERLREALEWYDHQARNCRKITSEGGVARSALDRDGGNRARTALTPETGGGDE